MIDKLEVFYTEVRGRVSAKATWDNGTESLTLPKDYVDRDAAELAVHRALLKKLGQNYASVVVHHPTVFVVKEPASDEEDLGGRP